MNKARNKTVAIHISGRRWFDKVNGNTYCSSRIFVNGELVKTMDFTYGYGDFYIQMSEEWLRVNKYLPRMKRYEHISTYCRNRKIAYTYDVADGLKRDMYKN
jgi:hypothetical protein